MDKVQDIMRRWAALRQYNRYGHGRSMKKFCEDEGYNYWKFCKLAREGQIEMGGDKVRCGQASRVHRSQSGRPAVTGDAGRADEICEIRIRFNNGLILSRRGGDVEEVISAIRKILS